MKRFLVAIVIIAEWTMAKAQDPNLLLNRADSAVISFKNTTYDYGIIAVGADPFGEFHFKNIGRAPLIISNVQSSCGCLIGEWSREPVMPGKSGIIRARYDTHRIGIINKSLTVVCNATEPNVTIRVKGLVIEMDSIQKISLPAELTFEKTTYDFGNSVQGAWPYADFHFRNTGSRPLMISNAKADGGVPEWPRDPIQPGMSGTLRVKLNTSRLGPIKASITVDNNGVEPNVMLKVKGEIHPKHRSLIAAKGPEITFDTTEYDLGTIRYGDGVHGEFRFMNTGRDSFSIINVNGSAGYNSPSWSKDLVMPGDVGVVGFQIDTRRLGTIHTTLAVQISGGGDFKFLRIKGHIEPATKLSQTTSDKRK